MPTNLRKELIRLAHYKPEMRKHLLPILKEADETGVRTFDECEKIAEDFANQLARSIGQVAYAEAQDSMSHSFYFNINIILLLLNGLSDPL